MQTHRTYPHVQTLAIPKVVPIKIPIFSSNRSIGTSRPGLLTFRPEWLGISIDLHVAVVSTSDDPHASQSFIMIDPLFSAAYHQESKILALLPLTGRFIPSHHGTNDTLKHQVSDLRAPPGSDVQFLAGQRQRSVGSAAASAAAVHVTVRLPSRPLSTVAETCDA